MIATKTTALLVTMAILGIVPVAAHAQEIDITDLIAQSGTAEQVSAPDQETEAVVVDNDENTNTPIVFVIQSQGAMSSSSATVDLPFTASDDDTNSATAAATQDNPVSQTPSQGQTASQLPTANPIDTTSPTEFLGSLPGSE